MNVSRSYFFFVAIFCSLLLSVTSPMAAQTANPLISGSEIGIYALGQLPLGNYSEMLKGMAGGGLSFFHRFDERMPLSFGVRLQGTMDVPNTDRIKSWWSGAAFAGVSYGIPLTDLFSINPELDVGVWLHEIKWAENLGLSDSAQSYFGPAAQLSVAMRISLVRFGFELAPVITMLPEKSSIPLIAGMRASLLMPLGGKAQ